MRIKVTNLPSPEDLAKGIVDSTLTTQLKLHLSKRQARELGFEGGEQTVETSAKALFLQLGEHCTVVMRTTETPRSLRLTIVSTNRPWNEGWTKGVYFS